MVPSEAGPGGSHGRSKMAGSQVERDGASVADRRVVVRAQLNCALPDGSPLADLPLSSGSARTHSGDLVLPGMTLRAVRRVVAMGLQALVERILSRGVRPTKPAPSVFGDAADREIADRSKANEFEVEKQKGQSGSGFLGG